MNNQEFSWQFSLNNKSSTDGVGASNPTRNRWLLWKIKEIMTSFPVNPWTVVSSSDSITSSPGDIWNSYTDLNWGQTTSAARSWIVLQQSAMNNFQLLIDCRFTFGQGEGTENIAISVSMSGGFTGGSNTTVPTASDGVLILSNCLWGAYNISASTTNAEPILNVIQSEDGYCTRAWVYHARSPGLPVGIWNIEKLKDSKIDSPIVMTNGESSAKSAFDLAFLTNSASPVTNARCVIEGNATLTGFTTEGMNGGLLPKLILRQNEISGQYEAYPANYFVRASNYRDIIGAARDFYFVADSINGTYFSDADGNPKKWVAIQNVLLPWDGTSTLVFS